MAEINWEQELLESNKLSEKERNLLIHGAKSLAQSWYLGALYTRWEKLKGFKEPPAPNCQSSFLEWERSVVID